MVKGQRIGRVDEGVLVYVMPGSSNKRGQLSTIDLLVLISLDQRLFYLKNFLLFLQTSYFNEEVNSTDPSPSVSVPWSCDYTGNKKT